MDQMDDELNLTFITFGGHVELEKYKFLYFAVMFIAYILILCSNSTIFCLIWIKKSLHEPMYIFIAGLLFNSVMFSTNIYPKLLMDFLSEKQITTHSFCSFQVIIFYSLTGSEFFLLAAMSYDRYVSICKPLQYHTIMRRKNIKILLVLAWLLPACQLMPSAVFSNTSKICNFTLNGIFCNNAISRLYCAIPKSPYLIYGVFILINTVFLPLLFILFTYSKIFIICYQSCREVRKKAAQTCLPHLLVLISFTCLCSYDVIIARLEINLPQTARFIMTLQVILYHPLFNPIVYGLKMKEISQHLRRLFYQGKFILCIRTDVERAVISVVIQVKRPDILPV
ncbi:olfactory receptor 8K3-like [Archocentrus centrarchus]|uniref:olfactory receptor 8K3-like n=1 Tax=Archocentrus centrarchus TaxID=63155 RepID=UPI0011E9EC65|nr:olfactory receptor 8K3-like [Archocentrus centrarchus]